MAGVMMRERRRMVVGMGAGCAAVVVLAAVGWAWPDQDTSPAGRRTVQIVRKPVRVMAERYAGYSAVAVDPKHDEIVAQDENFQKILVYNRTTSTPATASMSEPKRIIAGERTGLSDNCALYVDPETGDIYSVNNDTHNYLSIFSHEQSGDVEPTRKLLTPHRTFGIALDEKAKELYLTIQHPPAVIVWRKMAQESEAPLRIIQGYRTGLADAHGIAVDQESGRVYVVNRGGTASLAPNMGFAETAIAVKDNVRTWLHPEDWSDFYKQAWFIPGSGRFEPPSITVYGPGATGNVEPIAVISGPNTQLSWPADIQIDARRGELFVVNAFGDSVLVFRTTDTGDVAPARVLRGPRTKIRNPHGVRVDTVNDELLVANFGNYTITAYPRAASGDTPPLRVIRSAPDGSVSPMFGSIGALDFDRKRGEILAPN
jgi:DNA-binding beta-propeller fold protein YncE